MTTSPLQQTVFVVDDDAALRKSLSALVTAMGLDVQAFPSGQHFLDEYDESIPGCLVLDLRLPGMSGLDLIQELHRRRLQIPIVMISGHGDIRVAVSAIKSGVIDFLEKPYRSEELRQRIRQALEIDQQRRRDDQERRLVEAREAELTDEERQVMKMMIDGRINREIADTLDVSLRTVHTRRASVLEKLQVRNRTELLKLVVKYLTPKDKGRQSPE